MKIIYLDLQPYYLIPLPNTYIMTDQCITRTRQRKYKHAPPLAVPNIDDDAAERKRVLNVLAQRRYRTYIFQADLHFSFLIQCRRRGKEANQPSQSQDLG